MFLFYIFWHFSRNFFHLERIHRQTSVDFTASWIMRKQKRLNVPGTPEKDKPLQINCFVLSSHIFSQGQGGRDCVPAQKTRVLQILRNWVPCAPFWEYRIDLDCNEHAAFDHINLYHQIALFADPTSLLTLGGGARAIRNPVERVHVRLPAELRTADALLTACSSQVFSVLMPITWSFLVQKKRKDLKEEAFRRNFPPSVPCSQSSGYNQPTSDPSFCALKWTSADKSIETLNVEVTLQL